MDALNTYAAEQAAELKSSPSSTASSSPLSLLSSRLPLRNLLSRGRRNRVQDRKLSATEEAAACNTTIASPEGSRLGPIQYLMTGNCADISPLTFLHAQVELS